MTRQHRKRLEYLRAQEQAVPKPTETKVVPTLPGGPAALREILVLKAQLHSHLNDYMKLFTITVDYDGEWCFIVRSPRKPHTSYFAGHKIYWIRSHTASCL